MASRGWRSRQITDLHAPSMPDPRTPCRPPPPSPRRCTGTSPAWRRRPRRVPPQLRGPSRGTANAPGLRLPGVRDLFERHRSCEALAEPTPMHRDIACLASPTSTSATAVARPQPRNCECTRTPPAWRPRPLRAPPQLRGLGRAHCKAPGHRCAEALRCQPVHVDLRGFEPLTPSMPWRCATELRHRPVGAAGHDTTGAARARTSTGGDPPTGAGAGNGVRPRGRLHRAPMLQTTTPAPRNSHANHP